MECFGASAASLYLGGLDIRPDTSPSLDPTARLGARFSERIARVAKTVRVVRHKTVGEAAPRHGGGGGFVTRDDRVAIFDGSVWRIDRDSRPHTTLRDAVPYGDEPCIVDDVELLDSVVGLLRKDVTIDAHERAERVVWRPRTNQFVVRIANNGTILTPSGREVLFMKTSVAELAFCNAIGCSIADLASALINDPVMGRSEYRRRGASYDRYTGGWSPETFTRVVGFSVVRRIRAMERTFRTDSDVEKARIATAIANGTYITSPSVLA